MNLLEMDKDSHRGASFHHFVTFLWAAGRIPGMARGT